MAQKTLFQVCRSSSLSAVSIIGSAGRRGDAEKMTKELYWSMVEESERVISEELQLDLGRVHLVSGGAAWADHIAVTLFLEEKAAALTLHIPAAWKSSESGAGGGRFEDNGKSSQSNPGRVANKLHNKFSEKISEDTLKQIESSRHMGANLKVHDGFKKRNDSVAQSEYLVAFSWSGGEEPTKGGTLDTWSKWKGKKRIHIPLSSLEKHAATTKTKTYPEQGSGSAVCFSSAEHPLPTHTEPEHAHSTLSKTKCGDTSSKIQPSCSMSGLLSDSSVVLTELSGSCAESVDSGIGSLDSVESAVSADKHSQEVAVSAVKPLHEQDYLKRKNKRKRSESLDILEDSDNEFNVAHNTKDKNTPLPKKPKVSDFARQALYS